MDMIKKPLGIYVHIPFCVQKCKYCDFLSFAGDEVIKSKYVEALIKEIDSIEEKFDFDISDFFLNTIYIGGGTPSTIESDDIVKIVNAIKKRFGITDKECSELEITIEINPGTIVKDKLINYKRAGINRISIGLQSANDDELKLLGRIHDKNEFVEVYRLVRECGFENINVDLITALPGQTKDKLLNSLELIREIKPEHVSAYSLIIEEETPFYDMYADNEELLPTEEEERDIYYYVSNYLNELGYKRYEISNYAYLGYESKHNSGYWKRVDYLGLGLGASSLINNVRYKNIVNLSEYFRQSTYRKFEENYEISLEEQMEEFVFLGLRMSTGIEINEFEKRFNKKLTEVYDGVLNKLKKDGLIMLTDGRMKLTDKGIDYGNYVFSQFLL